MSTVALRLRIVPNARCSEVLGAHGDAIKVEVQAPAMDGRSNEALLAFLTEKLGVTRKEVELLAGEKSRDKTVRIAGMDATEASRRLLQTANEARMKRGEEAHDTGRRQTRTGQRLALAFLTGGGVAGGLGFEFAGCSKTMPLRSSMVPVASQSWVMLLLSSAIEASSRLLAK